MVRPNQHPVAQVDQGAAMVDLFVSVGQEKAYRFILYFSHTDTREWVAVDRVYSRCPKSTLEQLPADNHQLPNLSSTFVTTPPSSRQYCHRGLQPSLGAQ